MIICFIDYNMKYGIKKRYSKNTTSGSTNRKSETFPGAHFYVNSCSLSGPCEAFATGRYKPRPEILQAVSFYVNSCSLSGPCEAFATGRNRKRFTFNQVSFLPEFPKLSEISWTNLRSA